MVLGESVRVAVVVARELCREVWVMVRVMRDVTVEPEAVIVLG